jgi:hypothetical protein
LPSARSALRAQVFIFRSTKSAPPLAGKPVACGDPRPGPPRHDAHIPSSETEGEDEMIALYDHIQELRAELRRCYLARRERAETEAELARAIARQEALDRAFDEAIEAENHRDEVPD